MLRRHVAAVVKSMVDLNWFGGVGRECGAFLYSVNSNISIVRPLARDVDMDHFDKAIGHVFDVEARAQLFRRRYADHPNVRIVDVCLEQVLDDPARFLRLLGLRTRVVVVDRRLRPLTRARARQSRASARRPCSPTPKPTSASTRSATISRPVRANAARRGGAQRRDAVEYAQQRIDAFRRQYAAANAWLPGARCAAARRPRLTRRRRRDAGARRVVLPTPADAADVKSKHNRSSLFTVRCGPAARDDTA